MEGCVEEVAAEGSKGAQAAVMEERMGRAATAKAAVAARARARAVAKVRASPAVEPEEKLESVEAIVAARKEAVAADW